MLDIDRLLANMPKDEDELKTVQEKHRQILQENRDKKTGMLPVALPTKGSDYCVLQIEADALRKVLFCMGAEGAQPPAL